MGEVNPAGAAGTGPADNKDNLIPTVKHTIAISSGKGGVGKSTVAVNLACALVKQGARVGLMDADMYGPNVPMMMGDEKQTDQKGKVPILSINENMSYYVCGRCGERTEIFSYGGGERAAEKLGLPFLGRIPIDPAIRAGGDSGMPIVVADPNSPQAKAFTAIASAMVAGLGEACSTDAPKPIETLLQKIKRPLSGNPQ